MNVQKKSVSKVRKVYIGRLIGRCLIFVACLLLYFFKREELDVLHKWNFFKEFSLIHLLWLLWVLDMVQQLVPVKSHISIGSQKLFKEKFRPITDKINYQALRSHVIATTKGAYKVFIIWFIFIGVIGLLYHVHVFDDAILFLISAAFFVCDLICVLIWCPFRLIMKNRCCTTCRIFNWDHLMMFTPMMFVRGFYSMSLLGMSIVVWLVWELCVMMYPERFWEQTNAALRCSECTDKLCTQYCQKLRRNVDKK